MCVCMYSCIFYVHYLIIMTTSAFSDKAIYLIHIILPRCTGNPHTHTHTHTHTLTYTSYSILTCMHTYIYTHIQPHARTHIQPHAHTHVQPHARTHIQPHAHTHIQPHARTHILPFFVYEYIAGKTRHNTIQKVDLAKAAQKFATSWYI